MVSVNVLNTRTIISLLESGRYYAQEKRDLMYDESRAPYGYGIYTEEDFNAIEEEIEAFEMAIRFLRYALKGAGNGRP